MAKSSKVEDYWRQNNIENLLKELTQILVRRMPSDPAIAIVEHLQKKFPKSFKTSTDNIGVISKTQANNLQLQSITSPHSDIQNESTSDLQIGRPSSNQSQISGIATTPTVGSAFTDLFKQDTNSSRPAPQLNIRNLVFANRLGQQVVKMRKDIRSDHDILEEEVIKPNTIRSNASSTANPSNNSISDDLENAPTHEERSVVQLIKYKQQIRTENDRRLHREQLAEVAKNQREKEKFVQSDLSSKPEDIQQQNLDNDETLSQVVPKEAKTNITLSHKPIVKSKEEEEILNDENVFQPRKQRSRGRQRNKISTSRSNTPYIRGQHTTDFRSSMKRDDERIICKVCGNIASGEDNQPIGSSQLNSAAPTARSFQPQPSNQSVETKSDAVDDWFEPASNASSARQSSLGTPDDVTPPPTGSNTFRRNLFQPINDTIEHRPPIRPLIPSGDNEIKTKRSITPRISESGVFSRSPEPKIRRSSSPVIKKQQTDTSAVLTHQLSQEKSIPSSTTMNGRRMSGWSVREHSPTDSDEN